ncbi:Alpha/Beta hydrolase protein [Mycena rosella]|uniref:Carboxylic ester hydrolase n=1 Tax=Mycena rosella TaxID=1033263 RepID=A0AAD7H016_MYCRO|nr:Alpha/Beta hydrolase protein [Mycena rosella]
MTHLHTELLTSERIQVETKYGTLTGGRAANGTAVFLEVPYGLPPARFQDPIALPLDFRYAQREYTRELTYATQPTNDGQARDTPFEDKVGYGKPSENALALNVVSPASFPTANGKFPVRVYIHGGFLQFGSPHGLQAQCVSEERSEVWVNIGYRLSAFGFLACDQPKISGNFGFKDQWLALEWIKENIESFGGDPDNIKITGLSAGAHSVHQLLHYASHLPEGVQAPFHSAVLQSNAIVCAPRTLVELRPQFEALCRALTIDPAAPNALELLSEVPSSTITKVIETLGEFGTFRACMDGPGWLPASPDPMAWQRTGFASSLRKKGVKSILIGDLTEEWYLYSIAHPIDTPKDIVPTLERYYARDMVMKLVQHYDTLPEDATSEASEKLFGQILSDSQVHLPIRILVRDLHNAGFPVLRYEIRWTPEQNRPEGGYVTHGSDKVLWAFRTPELIQDNIIPDQIDTARTWLRRVAEELEAVESAGKNIRGPKDILILGEDRVVEWEQDEKWDEKMRLLSALPE